MQFQVYFYSIKLESRLCISYLDFNSGAMENWGLVTYRETYLLYNPKTDTIRNKKLVSVVIAHELAHHWASKFLKISNFISKILFTLVWKFSHNGMVSVKNIIR